jgi:hypothetical protein
MDEMFGYSLHYLFSTTTDTLMSGLALKQMLTITDQQLDFEQNKWCTYLLSDLLEHLLWAMIATGQEWFLVLPGVCIGLIEKIGFNRHDFSRH